MSNVVDAKKIIKTLNDNGFKAYIVGGYVRDYLLNKHNEDIDIATNAKPEDVKNIFSNTILTGLKHGTVTVVYNDSNYEITTFRQESTYINNRKPEEVYFVKTLREDVLRRDFTMNALALTNEDKITDYVNGIEDIKNKVIRTVGNPYERFNEDALRMLRAFRFVSTLGFNIDTLALDAIKNNAHLIKNISFERILKEFENMIKGEFFLEGIKYLIETNFHNYLPFKNGLVKINETKFKPFDMHEFLAFCICCDESSDLINQLPISNMLKREVKIVYEMYEVGIVKFNKILLFRNGLKNCLIVNKLNVYLKKLNDEKDTIINEYKSMTIHKQCDLKFKGDQIIELYNKKPGSWISEILDDICLKVLLNELENDYEKIRQYLLSKN